MLATVSSERSSKFENAESCSGTTVLLVEDQAFVREVTGEVLRSAGYRVLKAANAQEALALFRRNAGTVDLLVTDVVLPGQNGCQLAAQLRSLAPALKMIVTSGYPEHSFAGTQMLGVSYLAKPFSADSLLKALSQALHAD